MSVKLWVPSSSGHPLKKTPSVDFYMQTHSHCEQHSAFHFNQSQQAINTTHPWGFGSHYSLLGKKKILWKKSEGWINWACSCLLYIWDVTKFMLLHRIFFTRDEQERAVEKPEQNVYSAHPWLCFHPTGDYAFCRTWHVNSAIHLLQKFFNSVYHNEKIFPFFSFCLTSSVTVENKGYHCIGAKHSLLLGFIW